MLNVWNVAREITCRLRFMLLPGSLLIVSLPTHVPVVVASLLVALRSNWIFILAILTLSKYCYIKIQGIFFLELLKLPPLRKVFWF